MFDPKTRAEAEKHRYGCWGGCTRGRPYDPACCAADVSGGRLNPGGGQCLKKPGKGPDGLFCAIHDPDAVAKKRKAAQDKYDAELARKERGWKDQAVGAALRESDPDTYRKLAAKIRA